MTRKQKKMLWRILGGTAVFILSLFLPLKGLARLAVFLIPYAIAGWDVLWKAVRNICNGQVFDENFLMSVATFAPTTPTSSGTAS